MCGSSNLLHGLNEWKMAIIDGDDLGFAYFKSKKINTKTNNISHVQGPRLTAEDLTECNLQL